MGERPNTMWFRSINCVNGPRQCSWPNKVLRFLSFFTVILIGLKKFATLLPNNWLAKTPQPLAVRRLGRQSAERERISEIHRYIFLIKKLQANSLFFEFVYSLKVCR
ncbi:hypothetical protein [Peribacillus sp. NPDC058075]|uniref:hypothetical protein n=1 Tax=unclassified Peribacillus TaxID=2675266 RepID=UPI0036DD89DB